MALSLQKDLLQSDKDSQPYLPMGESLVASDSPSGNRQVKDRGGCRDRAMDLSSIGYLSSFGHDWLQLGVHNQSLNPVFV